MSDLTTLLDLATRAARAAGELLQERFGGPQSGLDSKSSRTDLVSDADRDAEALLVGMLRAERPDDGLLAEEGSAATGTTGVRWILDPLDGTINYLWGDSALVGQRRGHGRRRRSGRRGVRSVPRRDVHRLAGGGAWLAGDRLTLTSSDDLAEALVGTGFAYVAEERELQAETLRRFLPHVRDVRRFGSAALDLAWVAAGRLDAFYETGLSPWDWAGGSALVREAGGTATTLTNEGRRDGLLAARPGLAAQLLALIEG